MSNVAIRVHDMVHKLKDKMPALDLVAKPLGALKDMHLVQHCVGEFKRSIVPQLETKSGVDWKGGLVCLAQFPHQVPVRLKLTTGPFGPNAVA